MIETVLGRISSISRRAMRFLVDAGRQPQLIGCLAAKQAVKELAIGRGDGDRLEAADQAGAREDDGLQKVAFGADRTDFGEVRADVAAAIADGVARVTGGFFTVEDNLAAADVAGLHRGQELFKPGLLPGGIDVERRQEQLKLFLHDRAIFRRGGP